MSKVKHILLCNFITNILVFFALFIQARGQVSFPNTINAAKTDKVIKIDGLLDEEIWGKAQIITNFTQRELNNGLPVTERTEAAIIYDSNFIYIGIWCYDSEPNKITAKYFKRDFPYWYDDNFEIAFDTYNDNSNGYIFVINPNGARSDLLVSNDGTVSNRDWNGVWDAATVIDSRGWFAEIGIPFSTLKFPDLMVQEWGINLERNIRRKQEQVFWQGWSRNYDFEHVSQAGTLLGLKEIKGRESIELKPFVKLGGQYLKDKPFDPITKIGGDINYLITPTLKFNITLNTDFAQVESDEVQVNLTRFETNYTEKREFFLEGADFFKFTFPGNASCFYSRKIGIYDEQEIPIIGGVRLLGKQGNTNIGLLSIWTNSKDSVPTESHNLIRIKQEISPNISIGAIGTYMSNDTSFNYLYGCDVKYNTAKFLGDNKLYLGASIAQSKDKNISDNSSTAYSIWATLPNDLVYIDVNFSELQGNFRPGLGFLPRENYKRFYFQSKYRPRPGIEGIHQFVFVPLELSQYWNSVTNVLESSSISVQPFAIITKSGEYFGLNYSRQYEYLTEKQYLVFGKFVQPGKYENNRYSFNFLSFEGREISFGLSLAYGGFYDGTSTDFSANMTCSVSKNFVVISDFKKSYVDLLLNEFQTNRFGLRLEYSFNPKLYSSLYTQWTNIYDRLIINFRINWIPIVGSDLYFVVNQIVSTANSTMSWANTSVILKYIHRIGI